MASSKAMPAGAEDGSSDTFSWADAGQRLLASPAMLVGLIASVLLFLAGYGSTLASLVHRWNADPNYGHGYLVPLASAYLLHQSLESAGRRPMVRGGALAGSVLLVVGMMLLWGAALVPSLVIECVSMLLVLSGVVLLVGGREWWGHSWAPILFLSFMIPWPSSVYSRVAFPLQLFVSEIAATVFQLVGMPVFREGSLIHLPGQTMHVAQACSGLRQLTAFLAMATCLALLVQKPAWYRMTLLASAIPIAVFVNVVRVVITGWAFYLGYGSWTEGLMHTLEGIAMVLVGLGILFLEIRLLDWLEVTPQPRPGALATGGSR